MISLLVGLAFQRSDWFPVRWFYVQTNLAVVANVDTLLHTMDRGRLAGYNGMVITDSKFSILDQMGKNYFDNAARVREKAAGWGIAVIPVVADVGWSGGLLAHDVNLIEGQPVKKAPFVVKNGTLQPLREVTYANGDMEDVRENRLQGYTYQDGPGTTSFSDSAVKHGGARSLRFESFKADNQSGNARVMHALNVRPWQQYRARVWLKTDGVGNAGDLRCFAMGEGGKVLSFMDLGAKATQDWTEHTIVFNSQGFEKVTLYAGLWGGTVGKFWLDDISVEEAGFLNVLRRSGAPIKVESESGTSLTEGKDFDPIADPNLGQKPWPGEYTFTQASPAIKTKLPEGTKVLASFTHAVATEMGKTAICPSEPKSMEIVADQIRRVSELWKPNSLFLAHDEIRVANQCPLCTSRGMTPGEIYAENLKQCVAASRKALPGAKMYVWSDMFDPAHNAVDGYYLSNGSWKDSWKGVTPDVSIVNWNSGNAKKSLGFFMTLGVKQILAGYYDAPVKNIKPWLETAKTLKGIDGVMYTTWAGDYTRLEEFAEASFKKP